MSHIRQENANDYTRVGVINALAFGQENEKILVDKLRKNTSAWVPELSLVATADDGVIVGHILFTIGKINKHETLVLAPLAVHPDFQKRGVGTALIKQGIRKAIEMDFSSINVLGHKSFYSKFGFKPASKYNITCAFDLPDVDVFRVLELKKDGLEGVSGKIEYAKEFLE